MNILRATIVKHNGVADQVTLTTDQPSSMPKVTGQNLFLRFEAEAGTGETYCTEVLGLHYDNIQIIHL